MKTAREMVLTAILAAVGCGGAKPDATAPLETARDAQRHDTRRTAKGPMAHEGGPAEADEMAAMPAPIQRFHDVLAPRWHAERGPQRMADSCAAIPEFRTAADAIVAAPAPQGRDAAAWSAGGKQLADAVAALDATCKASDAAAFEPAFAKVHERFHGVMAAAAGEHGEHGEHDDHDDHDDHDHPR